MNMIDTLKGSYFSEILPEGWDISKIKECVSNDPASVLDRQSFWNEGFYPVKCSSQEKYGAFMREMDRRERVKGIIDPHYANQSSRFLSQLC